MTETRHMGFSKKPGEYYQDMLYEIIKELIKYYFEENIFK